MAKEVVPGVYQFDTRWRAAKAFLIVEETLTLIDTGLKGSQGQIERLLKDLGRTPNDIKQIIVTHCHLDHAGSLAALKTLTGASIAIHKADAAYISKAEPLPYHKQKGNPTSWIFHAFLLPLMKYPAAAADQPLEDGDILDGLEGLRVLHTPGHTPGHICLYSEERKTLFPGDILTVKGEKIGLPGKTYVDDQDQFFKSLERLRGLPVEVLCASHGGTLTKDVTAKIEKLLDEVKSQGTG